jgi:predicted O-linked N-acetylglucosamine transferase (SPINDLY family)
MRFNTLRDARGARFGASQFVYDVTERLRDQERLRRAEHALRQAQRMESLGQLTGGVAHDFNNLLAVFAGGVQVLERNPSTEQRQSILAAMRRAVSRGTGLTRHLLPFSRRRPVNPASIDLAAHLGTMREMLAGSLRGDIQIEMKFDRDLWQVEIDAGEMDSDPSFWNNLARVLDIGPGQMTHTLDVAATLRRAVALHRAGDLDEAARLYRTVLNVEAKHVDALTLLGTVCLQRGEWAEGLRFVDRSLALNPKQPQALVSRGNALTSLKRFDAALVAYDVALALKPDLVEAFINRGNVLRDLGRFDDALRSYDRAIALKPDYAKAHNHRASVLRVLRRPNEALASSEHAIAIRPDYAEAFNQRALVLRDLGLMEEALRSCDRAIALKPDFAHAHHTRGKALCDLGRPTDALRSNERALRLDPKLDYLEGSLLHLGMLTCDWTDLKARTDRVLAGIKRGARVALPFELLATSATPAQQQRCAITFSRSEYPPVADAVGAPGYAHDRIRLGYFSADFHDHAVSILSAELFGLHDRGRFEVCGFSHDAAAEDGMRRRLRRGFDRFIDVANKSDRAIAAMARDLEIDIAIDLGGHTGRSRPGILAHYPAPIRVHFLGYPGTLGASFVDYLIADPIVVPSEQREFYTERIVYLPDTCQVNDRQRVIADRTLTRDELGLPATDFVFCCFNGNYKIEPTVFDVWMRLLRRVEGSVLWLVEDNGAVPENLRREAIARGVSGDRIIFAPRIALPDHMARHRAADLFLDTFNFNAHTTASAALWAGLPVLTCRGKTFAGRIGASVLTAIGLPELIAGSHAEYEALAIELARQPDKLDAIQRKLREQRSTYPLFDTPRFARNLETAYARMLNRARRGLPPEDIDVARLDDPSAT